MKYYEGGFVEDNQPKKQKVKETPKISIKDWKDEVILNPEGFMFNIQCKKCKGTNILFETVSEIGEGSEYTGVYGEASIVIKCKTCGNAYSIITTQL